MRQVIWVLSSADGLWHAVPVDEMPTAISPTYNALCGLMLPANLVTAGQPSPQFMHQACLIEYGRSMPYNPRSEQD